MTMYEDDPEARSIFEHEQARRRPLVLDDETYGIAIEDIARRRQQPSTPAGLFQRHGGDLERLRNERNFVQGDMNARALSLLSNEERLAVLREAGDDEVTAAENAKEVAAVFRPRPGMLDLVKGIAAITPLYPAVAAVDYATEGIALTGLGGGQAIFRDQDLPSLGEANERGQSFPAAARIGAQVGVGLATPASLFTVGRLGAGAVGAAGKIGEAIAEGGIKGTVKSAAKDFLGTGDVKPLIEPDDAIKKLTRIVKEGQPLKEGQEAARSAELSIRAGRLAAALERPGVSPSDALRSGRRALGGELPRANFAPKEALTNDEMAGILNKVRHNQKMLPFDRANLMEAVENLTLHNKLPTDSEVELMERAFGKEMAQALISKREFGEKFWGEFVDAINLPRSLVATLDMSAPLRQGFMLGAGHPGEWLGAWKPMVRAFASEKYARMVDETLSTGPRAVLRDKMGVYRAPLVSLRSSGMKGLAQREEAFASRWASRIPGVRASERAYLTFLNKLRADVFDHTVDSFSAISKNMTPDEMQALSRFINHASGRGTILHEGQRIRDLSVVLNATFFSPRFLASRIEAPLALLPKTGVTPFGTPARLLFNVRGPAKDLVVYAGVLGSLMGLAKMGGMNVETDPRSSDFGKIRSDNTRIDLMSGNQQLFRAIWQLVDKETKSAASGRLDAITAKEVGTRFLRSKLSPTAGTILDLVIGRNMIGEVPGEKGVPAELWNRLAPLAAQDLWEAVKDAGIVSGAVKSAPSFFGAGASTFESVPSVKDEVAQERTGQRYIELDRGQQANIDQDERVVAAEQKYAKPPRKPDADEATTFAVQRYGTLVDQAEAEFANALEAGATGEALRKAVQRLGEAKADAGNALYDDPLVQGKLKGKNDPVLRDALAASYWGAPLDVDPETQTFRFEEQEADRERILEQADAAGIPREYITGTGANTYRAKRQFASPAIKEAVEGYDRYRIALKEARWNDFHVVYPDLFEADERAIYSAGIAAYRQGNDAFEGWINSKAPDERNLYRRAFNKLKDRINDARALYRMDNPEFDRLYVRFNDSVPMSIEGKRDVAATLPPERQLEVLTSGFQRIASNHRDALGNSRYATLQAIAAATPQQLAVVTGVSLKFAQQWVQQAKAIITAG